MDGMGFLKRDKKKEALAAILAFIGWTRSLALLGIVLLPLIAYHLLRPTPKTVAIGDDGPSRRVQDPAAYRRSMTARLVMDSDGEFEEALVQGKDAVRGRFLTYDGVAPRMPDYLKGILRPRDAKGSRSLAVSEAVLEKGLKSSAHASIVSNVEARAMYPAASAVDPAGPSVAAREVAALGAGGTTSGEVATPAAGPGILPGQGAGGGKGSSGGPGAEAAAAPAVRADSVAAEDARERPGPQALVTGGDGFKKAVSENLGLGKKPIADRMETLRKGGRIQKLLAAKTQAEMAELGDAEVIGEDAVYQLATAHAFSVGAAGQPSGCAAESCPSSGAKDSAGLVYDGSRMPGKEVGGGAGAVAVGGQNIEMLRKQAEEYEKSVDACSAAEKDKGKSVRDAMILTQEKNQQVVFPKAEECHWRVKEAIKAKAKWEECIEVCEAGCDEGPCNCQATCRPRYNIWQDKERLWQDCTGQCRGLVQQAVGQCKAANDKAAAMASLCPMYSASLAKCGEWDAEMNRFCNLR